MQCGKDEINPSTYSISGHVTYADQVPADGAIVTISNDAGAADILNSIVCGRDGGYSFSGLAEGTYYLSSIYNTENTNNFKSAGFNFMTLETLAVEVLGDVSQDLILVNAKSGADIINTDDESWRFDKAHSNINWATAYMGENALLTGKFNSFNVSIDFDESAPENTTISAWVQLSSANTGEPGRDELGKCLNGYLGVVTDTLSDGSYYVSDPLTDTAYYESVSISAFGDGYRAVGDFSFRGVTKSVNLYFSYLGQADFSAENDGSNIRGSFDGEFEFLAISDFGVSSNSISDKILLTINANYRKN